MEVEAGGHSVDTRCNLTHMPPDQVEIMGSPTPSVAIASLAPAQDAAQRRLGGVGSAQPMQDEQGPAQPMEVEVGPGTSLHLLKAEATLPNKEQLMASLTSRSEGPRSLP